MTPTEIADALRRMGAGSRAVVGVDDGVEYDTRRIFADVRAFIRHCGDQLDRVGRDSGRYLGLTPDGVPARWEERAPPVGTLSELHHSYRLTGHLPVGWEIEVSRIAPGFGHPGGGLQIQVRDDNGVVMRVSDLLSGSTPILRWLRAERRG